MSSYPKYGGIDDDDEIIPEFDTVVGSPRKRGFLSRLLHRKDAHHADSDDDAFRPRTPHDDDPDDASPQHRSTSPTSSSAAQHPWRRSWGSRRSGSDARAPRRGRSKSAGAGSASTLAPRSPRAAGNGAHGRAGAEDDVDESTLRSRYATASLVQSATAGLTPLDACIVWCHLTPEADIEANTVATTLIDYALEQLDMSMDHLIVYIPYFMCVSFTPPAYLRHHPNFVKLTRKSLDANRALAERVAQYYSAYAKEKGMQHVSYCIQGLLDVKKQVNELITQCDADMMIMTKHERFIHDAMKAANTDVTMIIYDDLFIANDDGSNAYLTSSGTLMRKDTDIARKHVLKKDSGDSLLRDFDE